MPLAGVALAVYLGGVVVGLAVMRDRWPVRIATALAWPLGIVALAVVAVVMVGAALYLWPMLAVVLAAAAGFAWVLLRA